ncbi:MAG: hypothetical protein ACE5IM_14360, partial [Nitrospinota bacterium]
RIGVRFAGDRLPSDHELDAVVGAYVAFLHARGRTKAVGLAEEGAVHLPAAGRLAGEPGLW